MRRSQFRLFLLFISTVLTGSVSGQYYFYDGSYYNSDVLFEVGLSGGAMNSLTDLGGKAGIGGPFVKDFNIGTTNPAVGFFVSGAYQDKFGLRLEATYGKVSAYDSILKGVTDIAIERYNRNLNFRSSITEFSAMAEIHPLKIFIDYQSLDKDPPRYSPYLLGGIGYFSFNPQAYYENKWIDLQPLSTEGQGFAEYPDRKPYKLKQFNFPLGGGVKYELSPFLNLRAEFVLRKLNTDYLDDCSKQYIDPTVFYNHLSGAQLINALLLNDRQIEKHVGEGGPRGKDKNNDSYFSFNIKASLVLGRSRIRD